MPGLLIVLLLTLGVVLVRQRWLLLREFGFKYTDHDQALMWYAATQFSKLHFHEPRFYGQDYNTMIEALLAAPLLALHVPHFVALPVPTSLLALVPFFLLAYLCSRLGRPFSAVFALALPLCLPLRFHLLTMLSRGFVTGGFFGCLTILLGVMAPWRVRFFVFSLAAIVSISILPNAALLVVPFGVFLLMSEPQKAKALLGSALGASLGLVLHGSVQYFYVLHPGSALFSLGTAAHDPSVSFDALLGGFLHLEDYLGDVFPLFLNSWGAILLLLSVPLILLIALRRYASFLALASANLMLVLCMSLEKIRVGSESIFYSWSRYFEPLPLMLVLSVMWVEEALNRGLVAKALKPVAMVLLALCGLWAYRVQGQETREAIDAEVGVPQRYLYLARVDEVYSRCDKLNEEVARTGAELVLFEWSNSLLLNYACPAVLNESFETLCPSYERRTWLLDKQLHASKTRLLFYGVDWNFVERAQRDGEQMLLLESRPNLIFVKMSSGNLRKTLTRLGIVVRPLKAPEFGVRASP